MMMAKAMPVKSIADIIKEHDTRLWRVLNHYVHESLQESDFSAVTQVGVDETSSKRGHNYVSLFVDMKSSQVLFATEGKDASTLERFKADLGAHHGDSSKYPRGLLRHVPSLYQRRGEAFSGSLPDL